VQHAVNSLQHAHVGLAAEPAEHVRRPESVQLVLITAHTIIIIGLIIMSPRSQLTRCTENNYTVNY